MKFSRPLAVAVWVVIAVAALVPIGSNVDTVNGARQTESWSLISGLVGGLTSGDPFMMTFGVTATVIAVLLIGLGATLWALRRDPLEAKSLM